MLAGSICTKVYSWEDWTSKSYMQLIPFGFHPKDSHKPQQYAQMHVREKKFGINGSFIYVSIDKSTDLSLMNFISI
jgi:hypothetical protein